MPNRRPARTGGHTCSTRSGGLPVQAAACSTKYKYLNIYVEQAACPYRRPLLFDEKRRPARTGGRLLHEHENDDENENEAAKAPGLRACRCSSLAQIMVHF